MEGRAATALAPRVSGIACGETAEMGMGADISGRRRELSCWKGEKAGRVGVAAGLVDCIPPMPG
jgi:hypothetical protein